MKFSIFDKLNHMVKYIGIRDERMRTGWQHKHDKEDPEKREAYIESLEAELAVIEDRWRENHTHVLSEIKRLQEDYYRFEDSLSGLIDSITNAANTANDMNGPMSDKYGYLSSYLYSTIKQLNKLYEDM